MAPVKLARLAGAFLSGVVAACVWRGGYPAARGWSLVVTAGGLVCFHCTAQAWRRRTLLATEATPWSWYRPPGPPGGSYWQPKPGWRTRLGAAALFAGALGLGFGRAWLALGPRPPSLALLAADLPALPGGRVLLTGRIVAATQPVPRGIRLYVRPDGGAAAAGLFCVTLSTTSQAEVNAPVRPAPGQGMRLTVPVRLTRPSPANPGDEPFTGVTPEGRIWAYAWGALDAAVLDAAPPGADGAATVWAGQVARNWERFVVRIRTTAAQVLTCRAGPVSGGIARALVLGDRSQMSDEVAEDFSRAGAVHLLVVSGLHLSVVAALAASLARGAGAGRRGEAAACALATLGYGALTGWAPPVTRAALMTLSAQAARALGRRADAERSLWLAVGLMLFHRPLLFCDAGFRLSVAATWGVVALGPALQEWPVAERPLLRGAFGRGLATALSAQAATIPLGLQYFGRVPLLAVAGGPLLVAISDALVEAGVLVLGVGGLFPALAGPLSAGFSGGVWLLWQSARLVGRLPMASVNLPAWPEGVMALYYLTLWRVSRWPGPSGAGRRPDGGRTWRGPTLVAGATLLGLLLWSGRSPDLEVTFLDVGQGDAFHLRLPGGILGPNLLVDTAGSPSRPVSYLRRGAVQSLAAVVVTHAHRDHRGGLAGVRKAFPVERVVDDEAEGWRAHSVTGVDLRVTGSPPNGASNEASRRLILRYRRFCLVATGDAPLRAGEPWLATLSRRGTPEGDRMVLVVKVPHHGAKESIDPEFLRLYRPDLAVIQVGPNSYGHPDAMQIAWLQQNGVRVARTDQDGAVRLRTDGRRVRLRFY